MSSSSEIDETETADNEAEIRDVSAPPRKKLLKEANKNGIRSKFLLSNKIEVFTDTLMIFDVFGNDLEHSLKIIQSRKILKSILVNHNKSFASMEKF